MSTWDLSLFYENETLWDQDFERFQKELLRLSSFKGTLHTKEGLKAFYEFEESLTQLFY